MRANEFTTDIGRKYEELYTKYYKRAHLTARKKGLTGQDANEFARQAVEAYKDRVRRGEWDPFARKKGLGRAEYK